ncbi:MAG: hypothetical protein U1E60_09135 [Reyranellaceae bacterium]
MARLIALSSMSSNEAFCSINVCSSCDLRVAKLSDRGAAGRAASCRGDRRAWPGDRNWRCGGGVAQRQHDGHRVAERHHVGGIAALRILDRDHAGQAALERIGTT